MAVTAEKVKALFAAYPNNNQNTVREFIDYIFTLTPGVPGGYLPLSGGTMTGNINMNGTSLLAAVFSGATQLASGQSIVSPTGNEQLTFGSALNPAAQLLMNGGAEGFSAGTAIGINNTQMFNALGAVVIGDGINPGLLGKFLWINTLAAELTHQTGNINITAAAGELNLAASQMGFFAAPAVGQAAAPTAVDASVISSGGAAVLDNNDSDVINNIRTRLNEVITALQAYGLMA